MGTRLFDIISNFDIIRNECTYVQLLLHLFTIQITIVWYICFLRIPVHQGFAKKYLLLCFISMWCLKWSACYVIIFPGSVCLDFYIINYTLKIKLYLFYWITKFILSNCLNFICFLVSLLFFFFYQIFESSCLDFFLAQF